MLQKKVTMEDDFYIALHEVGHVFFAYLFGRYANTIVFTPDSLRSEARANLSITATTRSRIALGGFAIEYLLFKAGNIIDSTGAVITESAFVQQAMKHASGDKQQFFKGDFMEPDGTWPAEMDTLFMKEAIKLADRLHPNFWPRVVALAETLVAQRQVDQDEIELILEPDLLPTW